MGLELSASRLLAPAFGYSIYVWGALLGVVMAALAVGYFLGGWIADKSGRESVLYEIIMLSFLFTVFIPLYGGRVFYVVSGSSVVLGSAATTLLIFGIPMTLLAMVSPMVIRLNTERIGLVGFSSGTVYAVSTLGSIVGTFATAFYLIPEHGTKNTILFMAALLLLVALAGLAREKYFPVAAFLLFVMLVPQYTDSDVVYQTESPYSLIKVVSHGDFLTLVVNQGIWSQTTIQRGHILNGLYHDYFSIGPALSRPGDALVLGVGGGISVKQLEHFYPSITIEAVDIDPKIIKVAKDYFNLTESERVKVVVEDARTYVRRTPKGYDFIEVDVFSGGPNIPHYLATEEFFSDAKNRLNDGGVLMMNVLSYKGYMELTEAVAGTMAGVFPSVYVIDAGGNQIIVAFKNETSFEEYQTRLNAVSGELSPVAGKALAGSRKAEGSSVVLTDDRTQIEELIQEMLSLW
jgi:spermidine synthase